MFASIKAYSRQAMRRIKDKLLKDDNTVIISINDVGDRLLFEGADSHRVHSFVFSDLSPRIVCEFIGDLEKVRLISEADSFSIVSIIKDINDRPDLIHLAVHCSAGVCRSGAVCEFARRISNFNGQIFIKDNPNIMPNSWVLDKLFESYLNGWILKE